jgi:sulfite exporter TauE/SafE
MCGAFAVLCGGRVTHVTAWHVGRLTSYAILGAVAGTFGSLLPGPSWIAAAVSLTLMLWFAAGLAGVVPEPRMIIPGLKQMGGALAGNQAGLMRYGFGIVNGFLPCGLVYTTLAIPVALGDPIEGALAMAVFGLGTTPVLSAVALGVRRVVARDIRVRRLVAAAVLAASLWSVALRQGVLGGGHLPHGAPEADDTTQPMEHR